MLLWGSGFSTKGSPEGGAQAKEGSPAEEGKEESPGAATLPIKFTAAILRETCGLFRKTKLCEVTAPQAKFGLCGPVEPKRGGADQERSHWESCRRPPGSHGLPTVPSSSSASSGSSDCWLLQTQTPTPLQQEVYCFWEPTGCERKQLHGAGSLGFESWTWHPLASLS